MKDYWIIPEDCRKPIYISIDGKQFYNIIEAYDYVESLGFDEDEADVYIQSLPQKDTP